MCRGDSRRAGIRAWSVQVHRGQAASPVPSPETWGGTAGPLSLCRPHTCASGSARQAHRSKTHALFQLRSKRHGRVPLASRIGMGGMSHSWRRPSDDMSHGHAAAAICPVQHVHRHLSQGQGCDAPPSPAPSHGIATRLCSGETVVRQGWPPGTSVDIRAPGIWWSCALSGFVCGACKVPLRQGVTLCCGGLST